MTERTVTYMTAKETRQKILCVLLTVILVILAVFIYIRVTTSYGASGEALNARLAEGDAESVGQDAADDAGTDRACGIRKGCFLYICDSSRIYDR